jgi:hypothetical protein
VGELLFAQDPAAREARQSERGKAMRYVLRWWETLGRPERIVAMSLAAGSVVAITNSTVWAVAVSYMAKQKAHAAIAGYIHTGESLAEAPTASEPSRSNSHIPSPPLGAVPTL